MSPSLFPDLLLSFADASWRASGLIVALIGLRFLLRGRVPAQVWFLAWLVVAVRLLVPLNIPAPWSLYRSAPPTTIAPAPGATRTERIAPTSSLQPSAAVSSLAPVPATEAAPTPPRWSLEAWLASIWIGGTSLLLLARALASWRFRLEVRRGRAIADARLVEILAAEIGRDAARKFAAIETDAVDAPALFGLVSPRLLFPPGLLTQLNTDELRLVVRHEIGHWRRRDLLGHLLLQAAVALHWWNPLAWIAALLARTDCELACDEFVLRRESPEGAGAYGTTLLKVFSATRTRLRAPVAAIGIVEGRHQLAQRVRHIAGYRAFGALRFALALIAIAGLGVASATRQAHAQEIPRPASPPPTPSASSPVAPTMNAAIEAQRRKVDQLTRQLEAVKTEKRIGSVDQQADIIAQTLKSLNAEVLRLQAEKRAQGTRFEQLESYRREKRDLSELPFIASHSPIPELKQNIVGLKKNLAAASERYAERHPAWLEISRQLAGAEAQLVETVAAIARGLELEHDLVVRQLESAKAELARWNDKAVEFDQFKNAQSTLARELNTQMSILQELAARKPAAEEFTVSIVGAVNRQGPIAFSKAEKPIVLDVIARAGGFAPNADRAAVRRVRIEADGTRSSQMLSEEIVLGGLSDEAFVLAGDVLSVPEKAPSPPREVMVLGQVVTQGRHALPEADRTLTLLDVILMAGGPTERAKTNGIRVTRRDPTTKAERVFTIDLAAYFSSRQTPPSPDGIFALKPGDVVFVPEKIL